MPPLVLAFCVYVLCLLMMPFCEQTARRKATNAEARKPGNEPHVHCPAYNLYVIQVIKRITEYGNEPEDGTKLVQGDHSAWPVQSGGACVQRQLQPYHTHVRATFQPSPNLPNHLHLP